MKITKCILSFFLSILVIDISHAQLLARSKHIEKYGNNTFTFIPDTRKVKISVEDPLTGEIKVKEMQRLDKPANINGEMIYDEQTATITKTDKAAIERYLLENILNGDVFLSKPDCTFQVDLHNAVIDKTGKLVYLQLENIIYIGKDGTRRYLTKDAALLNKVIQNVPMIKPPTSNGTNVNILIDLSLADYTFTLHNHKLTYKK